MGQPTRPVRRTRRTRPLTGRELAIGEVSDESKGTNTLPIARQTQPYPYRRLLSTEDGSSSSMADTVALLVMVQLAPDGRA